MKYETIILERKDGIGYLTLNRPDRANTISLQLMHDVVSAMEQVEADQEYRVVILTGAGKHFCGGADLRDFAERARERASSGAARQAGGDFVTPRRDIFAALEESRVPVIAAINGAAMGGGCEIALACDVRVISDTATIGLPEIRFGALPAGGGTQRLPRLVGAGIAKEMIFSGLPWTPEEAFRVGLVNRVAPAAELIKECEKMAAGLYRASGVCAQDCKTVGKSRRRIAAEGRPCARAQNDRGDGNAGGAEAGARSGRRHTKNLRANFRKTFLNADSDLVQVCRARSLDLLG